MEKRWFLINANMVSCPTLKKKSWRVYHTVSISLKQISKRGFKMWLFAKVEWAHWKVLTFLLKTSLLIIYNVIIFMKNLIHIAKHKRIQKCNYCENSKNLQRLKELTEMFFTSLLKTSLLTIYNVIIFILDQWGKKVNPHNVT